MANNKPHDNFGISRFDQRAILAQEPRPGLRRAENVPGTTKEIPRDQMKPGRPYEGSLRRPSHRSR